MYILMLYIYICIYCCNQIQKPDENITSTLVFTMSNEIILYIYMYMCNIHNIIYVHRLRTKRSEKRIKRIRSKRSEMHSDNLL